MTAELRGGPHDGLMIGLPEGFEWSSYEDDGELHIATSRSRFAIYRWLFGEMDHLDFAGYVQMKDRAND